MAELAFPYWAVERVLDGRLVLAEALGLPEVSRLETDRSRLRRALERNVRALVEELPPAELHRRHPAAPPAVEETTLPLEPPAGDATWREPLPLRFDLLRWRHGDAELAITPVLDILVFARPPDDLAARLPGELRAALARLLGPLTLRRLAELQRVTRVRVERRTVSVNIRSAKQRALDERRDRTPSVLARVAVDLTRDPGPPAYEANAAVSQLAELLTARRPRSVLLVGPSGVGKTAVLRELVRRRVDFHLGATPFWATGGARLVAGMSGYGMWQERCQQMVREAAKRKAVLHLGNLIELMEVGKSEYNATGIADFLRPYLACGDLLAVAECTAEQVPLVERDAPHLLDVFQTLEVHEPDEARGRTILRRAADAAVRETQSLQPPEEPLQPVPDDVLDTLDRLHRRYATYSAYPGRPLRFLRDLLRDHPPGRPLTPADVYAAFSRETGLPRVLLDPAEPLDLAATRRWFAGRVAGQPEAVELVADLLAATKAGLSRPRRPIASLVFIGPTGVGKTETAKALAAFLFGSPDRLTRFDMSEYADPVAVRRLVGGPAGGEGLLTATVRERPFSVVLLDEFEKAHPEFLDLLLQVLGEGRLTDAGGRLADFRNSVVILTSNLGAESFRRGAYGFAGRRAEDGGRKAEHEDPEEAREGEVHLPSSVLRPPPSAKEHFQREVQAHLRPELFNRLDRIVPFAPLDAATIARIAERHLHRLEARDGIRHRGVTLAIDGGVAAHLARHGFDVRYGARPLIRAIERELLAPLADALNRHGAGQPLAAEVKLAGDRLAVHVRPRAAAAGGAAVPLAEAAGACVALRRDVQALECCSCAREFFNDLARAEREQARADKLQRQYAARLARVAREAAARGTRPKDVPAPRTRPGDAERRAELARLGQLAGRLHDLAARADALEDEALLALHADPAAEPTPPAALRRQTAELTNAFDDILLTLCCRRFPSPDAVTLALFAEDRECLLELAAAYRQVAAQAGAAVNVFAYRLPDGPTPAAKRSTAKGDDKDEGPQFWRDDKLFAAATGRRPERAVLTRTPVADPAAFFADPPGRLVGVALRVRGPAAFPRFAPEEGLHTVHSPKLPRPAHCRVIVSEARPDEFLPPPGITRRGAVGQQPPRREYDHGAKLITDRALGEERPWAGGPLVDALAAAIADRLRRDLRALLEE